MSDNEEVTPTKETEKEKDDRILGPRQRLRSLLLVLGTAFQAEPVRAAVLIAISLATALGGAGAAYALKLLTDAVATRDASAVWPAVGLLGAVTGVSMASSMFAFVLRLRVVESTQLLIDERLIQLTSGIDSLEHYERPDYVDQIERLRERRGQLGNSVSSIISAVTVVVQAFGTVALLGRVHPLLLLLPAFGVPSVLLEGKAEKIRRKVWEENTERQRTTSHLFELATTAAPGKELRIFGVGEELRRRHRELRLGLASDVNRVGRLTTAMSSGGWILFAAGYAAALAFVSLRALDGRATPGDVVLVISLGTQVNDQIGGLVGTTNWMMQTLDLVRRWLWLSDYADSTREGRPEPVPVPERLASGISFEGVSFTYPGTETPVLEGVDVHLPAGATIAVVGDNGAGKTTLVKLLCQFYEPTQGSICVDGTDLRKIGAEAWRSRMAAGFQDFARFEFIALETIAVGDLRSIDDEPAVNGAVERAHATDVPAALPSGLATQLGKSFEDGHELSGGQWQKLALARAMMREKPLLLVLDEPTAALDAETEHALFERYAGAAKVVARETGAITVLVSHRFSTVRMADLILVVDGGGVAEVGSHRELVARGGLYAELYELQARGYR
jgi:ATP-binding cassette, subfamily B, bacterial